MSFKALLKFGSKEYDLISCTYTFHRDVDLKGRPASDVYGGTIDAVIESTEDTTIPESMLNNKHKTVDGTITFKKPEEDAKMKEVKFTKGFVVKYSESFGRVGDHPMLLSFTISANILEVGAAKHENDWPKSS